MTPSPRLALSRTSAAPGGWCQVAAAKTGSTDQDPRIVGIDYLEVEPLPGVTLLLKDFLDEYTGVA